MIIFRSQQDLIQYAEKFLNEKKKSLINDVGLCQNFGDEKYYQPAPFPALLYCFSIIDLLGALSEGNAGKNAKSTEMAEKYMRRFMGYTKEQANLLQRVFRHKIVHLAQPNFVTKFENLRIAWQTINIGSEKHLELRKNLKGFLSDKFLKAHSDSKIEINSEFAVSIEFFKNDVISSIDKYLQQLKKETYLQDYFEEAIAEIFGV